ncbi:leucine-rich repeat domain-containing protein [Enterococcus innesii]
MTGSLIMPDSINGMKIIGIGIRNRDEISIQNGWSTHNVFFNAKFDGELKLPTYLTCIHDGVFANSKFNGELIIPKGVTIIGSGAFKNSIFSGELKLPSGLSSIGDSAFSRSKFNGELNLPNVLNYIGLQAFYSSEFSGTLDVSNVTVIRAGAFNSSKINKVIRGDVEMSDGSTTANNSGIHPQAIKLANGSWYDGSND